MFGVKITGLKSFSLLATNFLN